MEPLQTKPTGVRLIMGYKFGKAIVQTLAGLVLVYGATHGLAAELTAFADHLREHAVHAWSNVVAAALLRVRPLERRSDRPGERPARERDWRACAREACLLLT